MAIIAGLTDVGEVKAVEITAEREALTADLDQRDLLALLLAESRKTNELLAVLIVKVVS